MRVNFATDQYHRTVGTVDGNFAVRMGSQNKIDEMDVAATVSDRSVLLAGREAVLMRAANVRRNLPIAARLLVA